MIQRIQSVYLAVASLAMMLMIPLPLVTFYGRLNIEEVPLRMLLSYTYADLLHDDMSATPWGVLFFSVLAFVGPVWALFGYNNRRSQIKKVNLCIANIPLLYITIAAYCYSYHHAQESLRFSPEITLALPFVSLVMLFLARQGIKSDEALVRAADRIR